MLPEMRGASLVCPECNEKTVELFPSLKAETSRNGGQPFLYWRCLNCFWEHMDDLLDDKATLQEMR